MKRFFLLLLPLALLPSQLNAATLFKTDFDAPSANVWTQMTALSNSPQVGATVALQSVGTIDVAGSAQPSQGVLLTAHSRGKGPVSAVLVSGLLPITTTETKLGKFTLSFSLSASTSRSIRVHIASFDKNKKRTGGLVGPIYPAAPDFYLRYALDLSTLKPDGSGKFQSTAPYVQFSFEGGEASQGSDYQLRLDNVNYATPAYYVSPNGSDTNDGLTENTAFATPQKALDVAQPGDICVLMDGTYNGGMGVVASFRRGGTPDAWITLKNYPGQKPLLTCTGWNTVVITRGSKEQHSDEPSLAYLEIRGLHVRGEGDVAKKKYPEAMNQPDPRTNTNGIGIDGRYMNHMPHHIRMADNLVEYCPAGGIGAGESDWVQIENNVSRFNCWTTIYATSGISEAGTANFDATDNIYRILIRNNICYRNQTYEIWKAVNRISDGNGIILDVNAKSDTVFFHGRTLVQSNLCFDNGGSGIHTVSANRVDIINNTAYLNSASSALQYPEIYTYSSSDVRIVNNILVAPVANVSAGEKPEPVNKLGGNNTNVFFMHNLYFGGNIPATIGEGDEIGDPQFVNPTRDGKVADFHLKPNSPAIGKGVLMPFSPTLDLDGKRRLTTPALGAYEK